MRDERSRPLGCCPVIRGAAVIPRKPPGCGVVRHCQVQHRGAQYKNPMCVCHRMTTLVPESIAGSARLQTERSGLRGTVTGRKT